MKNMKKILLIILPVLMLVSCRRNFDEPNPNAPTIANFWQTQEDAVRGVNAIYSTFHRGPALYSRWLFYHGILRSDEGFGSGGDGGLNNLMSFVQTDYNNALTALTWETLYVGIFRANQVLANVPDINMDATLKQRLIAEAHFLRGLFYFNLALYFGRPVIMLEPSQTGDVPGNATPEEAWAQVESDLIAAAPNLPVSYGGNDLGRATRGAAYALLGKTYMQQRQYQEALDALEWLVEGEGENVYDLVEDYRDNFLITTENNIESVFEIQFLFKANENTDDDVNESAVPNPGTSIAQFFAPRNGPGFSDGAARRWLIDTFLLESTATGERDPRLAASFLFDSTDERGPEFTMIYGQTFAQRYGNDRSVWFRKLLNEHWKDFEGFSSGNNYRMIRYADVLLMYAECLNALGRTGEAYQYVDRVRERAGMLPLSTTAPGMSQDRFLAQIKHERIVELAGEAWRWADLLRWGDAGPALAVRDPEFTNFVPGRHELYPIPQSDLDLNPNLTQNPGY